MNTAKHIICHCFGYSEKDIELDYTRNGRSTVLDKIKTAKQFGHCRCSEKNPTGR